MTDMALPFDRPVVSPVLVGRGAYLESLERALAQVAGGRGQTVLVAGEAGVGKSRLVAEATTRAERMGFVSLQGHCFEPDRSLPYAPLVDVLRARFAGRSPEAVAHDLGPAAPQLAKLLPELATLLPRLAVTAPPEPEQDKHRLFHALAGYFVGVAGPALVIVEDVHWSDDASLEFLLHLARQIASYPVLLLLTYRSD